MLDPAADLAGLFQAVVDIESVSGNEAALADAVEQALRPYRHLEVSRQGNVVVARTDLGRPQRVVIAGHLDTVPLAGNLPSRREVRAGEPVLTGRGSVDMKGGVAVQIALAAALDQPRHDLCWLFYDNEEVAADKNGLGRLAAADPAQLAADFAILMEPTAGLVEGGCQGSLRVVLETAGRSAHAARSWLGRNAIHGLGPALAVLSSYSGREIDVDGLPYREGLNAVRVAGGLAGNVIPDKASLEVNYRFAPDKTLAEAEAYVRSLFPGYALRVVDAAPPARPGLGSPLAADFLAAVGQPARPKYGWTDVARFAALGVPAVNFGPGDPNLAHTDDEFAPLSQVTACRDALADWLAP
ncbi:MAG: succinyl-diaminopimelate desuccinylase [Propionibacteriaceae bacterium]|jgi:succinyl-diaminopimelate desuccinylase|nr:succinyl-diaminopimelate desuccinylase [Propionibacteriaceae bacterium]